MLSEQGRDARQKARTSEDDARRDAAFLDGPRLWWQNGSFCISTQMEYTVLRTHTNHEVPLSNAFLGRFLGIHQIHPAITKLAT